MRPKYLVTQVTTRLDQSFSPAEAGSIRDVRLHCISGEPSAPSSILLEFKGDTLEGAEKFGVGAAFEIEIAEPGGAAGKR